MFAQYKDIINVNSMRFCILDGYYTRFAVGRVGKISLPNDFNINLDWLQLKQE